MKNMTVGQLIEELQQHDKDVEIRFSYNFGDHWQTRVAEPVRSVDTGLAIRSDYHRMDKVIESDEDDTVPEGAVVVVILGNK